ASDASITNEISVGINQDLLTDMNTNPVQITDENLQPNQMIVVDSIVLRKVYHTANYGDGGDIRIQYGNTSPGGGAGTDPSAVLGNADNNLPEEILKTQNNDTIYMAGSYF